MYCTFDASIMQVYTKQRVRVRVKDSVPSYSSMGQATTACPPGPSEMHCGGGGAHLVYS